MAKERNRDNWTTPDNFWNWVDSFYQFTLDACADAGNARCFDYLDILQNGLTTPWKGRVWCNPPFSQAPEWHRKAAGEIYMGNCDLVVVLGHAGVGAEWFQTHIKEFVPDVYLVSPRVQFDPPVGVKKSSNSRDSMLCVYRSRPAKVPRIEAIRWQ